ncbi:hypothetical protein [uncultured Methanofollis sp.]|uniref:hypothetical protein n=1 Tax=uncultured Methanofollis sp. TaxID=262500 RepID=UPI00260B405E|nr:hypothetical protein [uncultured Methanofollis sp.]
MTGTFSLRDTSVLISYIAVAAVIAFFFAHMDAGWGGIDGQRFHEMAGTILAGMTPYVDFVDPKPPLLYFTIALLDHLVPGGAADGVVMAALNVGSALILWRIGVEDYGRVAGYSAGLLYLVGAGLVQGYFLFSEQFAVFLVLCAYALARRSRFAGSGLALGLACGFKQYAVLGAVPLLLLMRAEGDRRYHRFVLPAVTAALLPFGVMYLAYGADAVSGALFWTCGVAPAYLSGSEIPEIPNYRSESSFSLVVNLVASIAMVLPTLLFAGASVARRGLRTPPEKALGLFALLFVLTVLIRQFLHYWIMALPFLALLACREFADDRPVGAGICFPLPEPCGEERQGEKE